MTVKELIEMLRAANPNALVKAIDIYDEGTFLVTGMVYNMDSIELTGESLD